MTNVYEDEHKKFPSSGRHTWEAHGRKEETWEWNLQRNFFNKVSHKIEVIFSAEKQILIEIVESLSFSNWIGGILPE